MSYSYPYYHLIYKPKGSRPSERFLGYAEVYKDAVQILLSKYIEKPPAHVFSLAPVLFLLRQYIELQLKGIIKEIEPSYDVGKKGHDIVALHKKALEAIDKKYGLDKFGQADPDCENFIKYLGETDASIGRYPEEISGTDFKIDPWLQKKIMTVESFNDIAEKIVKSLIGMEGFLQAMTYS